MRKDNSLRTYRYSRRKRRRSSPSAACARGSFAAKLPNFGGPQLPNGSLQRAHFWVSRSVALHLQYAPAHQRCTIALFGRKSNFSQDM
jgi:hypothetical protein